jgi:hypothetical protein
MDSTASVAWTYWPDWRGPQDLVVRVALATVHGARQLGAPEPACEIEIGVFPNGDVERFDSVDGMKAYVTASALKRFDYIEIRTMGADRLPLVTVTFVKGRWGIHTSWSETCPWLRRGVLLQVTPPSDGARERAGEVRDTMVRALARGWGKIMEPERWGETWNGRLPEPAVESILAERARASRPDRVFGAIFVPVTLLVTAVALTESGWAGDSLLTPLASGDGYRASNLDVLILAISGVVGWFGVAPATKGISRAGPSVAIGDTSPRLWRLTRGLRVAIPTALAGAIVSAVLLALGVAGE